MDFTRLAARMPGLLDMSLKRMLSIELISAPGRGKSEFIESLIQSQSERTGTPWGFQTLMLATATPADLLGFMIPRDMPDGRPRSVYTVPKWYQTIDGKLCEDYSRGILFLDEYGQGEGEVKRQSAELFLNGRVGELQLPKGWTVIAASNRANDRSGVTKSFDFIINRRMEIHVTDSIDAWKDWALRAGVHPIIVHFADQNPGIVFADGVPDKQGPWCTPRSLVRTGEMLEAFRPADMDPGLLPDDSDMLTFASGLIGAPAAAQLFATIRLASETPSFDEIVANPGTTKVPTKADAQYLVTYQMAHRVCSKTIAAAIEYAERMPKEFVYIFVKSFTRRSPLLAAHPAVNKMTTRNSSLMAAVGSI